MTLTVGNLGGDFSDWPSTLRAYWQASFGGRYLANYTEGFTGGLADIAAVTEDYINTAIRAIESHKRDEVWQARLDGYKEATFKARGLTEFGPL